ncbi:unnamed protein product [Effrenium voratum]|nr:unnamed protein product [Effrenium voratum]
MQPILGSAAPPGLGLAPRAGIETLTNFLEKNALQHLQRWTEACSQEMDVSCRMHAHVALTCLHRDLSVDENMILLLSRSCSYVFAWYEQDFAEQFGTELQMLLEVVQRRRADVISTLESASARSRKHIFDEVSKITSNFFAGDFEWQPTEGGFKCKKDRGPSAVFNTQTCTLWLDSGLLRPIPPKLQRVPQFVEFFRQHPVKLQPTCKPLRLATNCHLLSAVDDDGITLEMQWWSETKKTGNAKYVEPEDSSGMSWKEASKGSMAVGMPWEQDDVWLLPGGIECELNDVAVWLRGLDKEPLAEVWENLLRFCEEPGHDDEGDSLGPMMGVWYCQRNQLEDAKELVALQVDPTLGILEARFAAQAAPVIRGFAISEFGRHAFRTQIFCSDAALSYAALVPDAKNREVPLCSPQFAGRLGFLPSMESLALFDDGKRLWVPPTALQGLLPAVLLEGMRFWGSCDYHSGAVGFQGQPYNPPVYSSLSYTIHVTCEDGVAKEVTRQVGDQTWLLASPIHAPSGSQISRFAAILAPLEAMSHTLFWTKEDGREVVLVELPRVQLRFKPGTDPANRGLRLFSKEFGGFYLLNRDGVHDPEAWQDATGDSRAADLANFLAKMPHAVVLRSTAGAIRILVTNAEVTRPAIKVKPFSTELVVNRRKLVIQGLKTFLWDFHESGGLLLTSSLSGTLYLSLLTLLHRDYTATSRLLGSVGFDEGSSDRHPDASALRLKLILALIAHNPKHPLLNPAP